MKAFKKSLVVMLSLTVMLAFAGCGAKNNDATAGEETAAPKATEDVTRDNDSHRNTTDGVNDNNKDSDVDNRDNNGTDTNDTVMDDVENVGDDMLNTVENVGEDVVDGVENVGEDIMDAGSTAAPTTTPQ